MDGTVTVLVGTTKGAFLIDGGAERSEWRVRGPFCDGWGINHVVGDPASGEIWAGGGGEWTGAGIWHSPDGGESWQVTRLTRGTTDDWAEKDPEFAAMIGYEPVELPLDSDFQQIWSVGVLCRRALRRHKTRQPVAQRGWRSKLDPCGGAEHSSIV